MSYNSLLFIIFSFVLFSCKDDCKKVYDKDFTDSIKYIRLEDSLFKFNNAKQLENYLVKHPLFCRRYLELLNVFHLRMASEQLVKLFQNKALVDFGVETSHKFRDLSILKSDLGSFITAVKNVYPDFYIPEINTIVSGFHFEKDLLVSDSLIVISLDYFIGRNAKYRPPYFKYFLERYEPEYIVPMIALGVSAKFNEINMNDESMLANMVYYGKAMYFSKQMMPCVNDSLITMYTSEEMIDVNKNAKLIWAHFIDKKLLYETNRHTIDKYVGETPKVNEIGDKCPGRIGRWLGWEIVKSYMKNNPGLSLAELMKETDAQKIFSKSGYRP